MKRLFCDSCGREIPLSPFDRREEGHRFTIYMDVDLPDRGDEVLLDWEVCEKCSGCVETALANFTTWEKIRREK